MHWFIAITTVALLASGVFAAGWTFGLRHGARLYQSYLRDLADRHQEELEMYAVSTALRGLGRRKGDRPPVGPSPVDGETKGGGKQSHN